MTANVNVTPKRLAPLGGAGNDGSRVVYCEAAKATQSDTVTLQNIKEILAVSVNVLNDTTLTADTYSVATGTSIITLTGSTTGKARILAVVR